MDRSAKAVIASVLGCLPGSVLAAADAQNVRYACDRGVEIPAVYVRSGEGAIAVLVVEGRQIVLYSEPSASGTRYGWPSDGSNYVWSTIGNDAILSWRDGATNTETTLYTTCTQK